MWHFGFTLFFTGSESLWSPDAGGCWRCHYSCFSSSTSMHSAAEPLVAEVTWKHSALTTEHNISPPKQEEGFSTRPLRLFLAPVPLHLIIPLIPLLNLTFSELGWKSHNQKDGVCYFSFSLIIFNLFKQQVFQKWGVMICVWVQNTRSLLFHCVF